LVNAKCPLGKPGGHFVIYGVYAGLSSNSGVLGNGCPLHGINTFPYCRSTFKRHALLW